MTAKKCGKLIKNSHIRNISYKKHVILNIDSGWYNKDYNIFTMGDCESRPGTPVHSGAAAVNFQKKEVSCIGKRT